MASEPSAKRILRLLGLSAAQLAGIDALATAELAALDGVTAGTVTASKALIVDANKDLASLRHLTITGNLVTGATTLSETDLAKIDGITNGTVAASKAVVADANKDVGTIRHLTIEGNLVTGATTLSETDLAKIDAITNGTQAANKAVVTDANVNSGVSKVTALHIGATGSEVQVNATAAEINTQCDISAQAETITTAGVASVTKKNTKIDNTVGGAGAITLAAPDASMYGLVKTIEMTVDGGDITLSLANVQGGTAATTATFAAVNDTLILVGGTSKWHVIGQSGVVLS